MKRHFFKKFWSMALGFALLMTAAVPFAAFAQEAKPAQTPRAVVLEGVFNGIGVFEFVGNSIRYHHIAFQVPVDLTVNGQKWPITGLQYYPSSGGPAPDPFFTLDFTPDFRSYAVTEHDQVHTATLTAEDDRMELFVNQTSGDPATGKIRLEPKETKQQTAQAAQTADDPNRATVTIEVLGGEEGYFVFRENRIVFLSDDRDERFLPQVTVNGERWRDLDVSFPLDYVPVPGSEVIREEPCPNGNASHATVNDRLKLYFNNSSAPFRNTTPARFVVNLEKQPLPEKPDDKYVVTVRAKMAGHIAGFKFEGSRIVYYPILGEYPTGVTVNGKEWKDLEKPFELGFAINPAASEILEKSAGPLTPSRYPDSFVVRLGGRLWTGNSQFVARLNDDPAVASPVATGDRERLTLDLKLQGNVRLRFRGNKLYYTLFSGVQPSITVNGKRWEDLTTPFELDFAPDPASMALLDQRGPAVELTPGADEAELMLNSHGRYSTFQVTLAMNRRNGPLPPEENAEPKQAAPSGGVDSDVRIPFGPQAFSPFQFGANPNAGGRGDTVVFEAQTGCQCVFTFEGNTIACKQLTTQRINSQDGLMISVNGRLLQDTAKPIVLDFIPDFDRTEVSVTYRARSQIVKEPWMPVNVRRDGNKMVVTTIHTDLRTMLESTSYTVRVILKKPGGSPANGTAETAAPANGGAGLGPAMDGRFADAGELRQWNMMMQTIVEAMEGGFRPRNMTFDADVSGTGTFVIYGDTIRYRHEPGQPLPVVTVNGQRWENLDEPFVLAFVPQLFSEAVTYQFDADSPVASYPFSPISMVWSGGKLLFSTRAIPDGKGGACHYRVRFNLPEINPRRSGGFVISQDANSNRTGSGESAKAAEAKEERVVLEGVFDFRESFTFSGNTIRYDRGPTPPGGEPVRGKHKGTLVSVNGKPWDDLTKPFELDFTPDFTVRAKIVETHGRTAPMIGPRVEGAKLEFNDEQDNGDYYKLVIVFRGK